MSDVRIKIDLASGAIEVEAPVEVYADVLDRVRSFLPAVAAGKDVPIGPPAKPRADADPPAKTSEASEGGASDEGPDGYRKNDGKLIRGWTNVRLDSLGPMFRGAS